MVDTSAVDAAVASLPIAFFLLIALSIVVFMGYLGVRVLVTMLRDKEQARFERAFYLLVLVAIVFNVCYAVAIVIRGFARMLLFVL